MSESTAGKFKRDDVVIEHGNGWSQFFLVLSCGPRSFDLIEECGGTSRFLHSVGRRLRLAVDADFADRKYRARVVTMLRSNAKQARKERKAGARIRRGHVTTYHRAR